MKTKIIQISQADLVSSQTTPLQFDISMTWTRLNQTSRFMLPKQLRLENFSGVTLNFTLLKGEDELREYAEGAPYYALLPIVNGNVLVNSNNGLDGYLLIQASAGTVTGGATFYGLLYQ